MNAITLAMNAAGITAPTVTTPTATTQTETAPTVPKSQAPKTKAKSPKTKAKSPKAKAKSPKAKSPKKLTKLQKDAAKAKAQADAAAEAIPLITNIQERLDVLQANAASNAYYANNALCNSMGFYVVNQLLWNHRKATSTIKTIGASGIDPLNDGSAEQEAAIAQQASMAEIGFDVLPKLDAIPLIGVHKKFLRAQNANMAYCKVSPAQQYNDILAGMLANDNSNETKAAYDKFNSEQRKVNACSALIERERAKHLALRTLKDEAKEKIEIAYVLNEIQRVMQSDLTDAVWNTIPLWIQYKWSCAVLTQVAKAIYFIENTEEFPDATYDRLTDLANEMTLELEAAARTPEVKTAFGLLKLDERHELPSSIAKTKPVENGAVTHLLNNLKSKLIRVRKPKDIPEGCSAVDLIAAGAPGLPATQPAVDVQDQRHA